MMYYMDINMTIFHGLAMLVFWIIFFYIIFTVSKSNNNENVESAFDILEKRLVRGEISKEQFDDLKNHITKGEV
ncbi:MAG: hypothetical protein MJK08_09690 [Campylobacterales bacterium]|nr:hypothetical protein [Campylobacterales bacterium]